MNNISLALTAIMLLALVVIMAPNIIAMNRGKVLRNIAIWLAIFATLGLLYQSFGSGKSLMMPRLQNAPPQEAPVPAAPASDGKGFTPPAE